MWYDKGIKMFGKTKGGKSSARTSGRAFFFEKQGGLPC